MDASPRRRRRHRSHPLEGRPLSPTTPVQFYAGCEYTPTRRVERQLARRGEVLVAVRPSAGMTNIELQRTAEASGLINFYGVFSSDRLLELAPGRTQEFCLIFNMSESLRPGTHFVALVATEHHVAYLDPAGAPPIQQHVYRAVQQWRRRRFTYASRAIQPASSPSCALYCLYYLLRASRGPSASQTDITNSRDLAEDPRALVPFQRLGQRRRQESSAADSEAAAINDEILAFNLNRLVSLPPRSHLCPPPYY